MSTVDKLMALADEAGTAAADLRSIERYIASVEDDDWAQEQLKKKSAVNYAAREALRAAIVEALNLGEPVAWLLEPKVQRHPDRHLIRGCYVGARTKEDFEFAELDGDKYTPLYAPKDKP